MVAQQSVQQLSAFAYDPASLRYRHAKSGRYVKADAVRAAVDQVIDSEARAMRAISQRLINREINLAQWQVEMSKQVKQLHVAMALAASGGIASTSASDLGYIASLIKKQYKFLRNFANQIKRGDQPLNGSLLARSAMYAQSARGTFEAVRVRKATKAGLTQSRRVLAPAEHCPGCIREARKGWGPIGHNAPIGSVDCRSSCKCRLELRKAKEA